jgi:hypothetical protein
MHSFLTNKIVIRLMNHKLDLDTSVRDRSKTNLVVLFIYYRKQDLIFEETVI